MEITADTAPRLGRFFGASAEFRLNLQQSNDLKVAERTAGEQIRRTVRARRAA